LASPHIRAIQINRQEIEVVLAMNRLRQAYLFAD
jgi:hypothetical protein